MMIASGVNSDKINATMNHIAELAAELKDYSLESAAQGARQYDVEQEIWQRVLQIGQKGMDLYLQSLGDGDLGATVTTADGQELSRRPEPVDRRLRTVFGEHFVTQHVYARGSKMKIALWPIDALIELPAGVHSDLYREFSQYLCVDQSFERSSQLLETILGQKASVDSLERINRQLGEQAEQFFDQLSAPAASKEGELLVVTADGNGVPLVKKDAERVPAFDKRERPGNRRMATLGSVYTVDRYVRTPQDILEALFREEPTKRRTKRPQPQFKELIGRFSRVYEDGEEEITIPGGIETFAWIAERVEQRRRRRQRVIRLMDGQPSLWDAADTCLEPIATGVIEGACRHVVKDRMERSGMRWTLEAAQAMLNVRCVLASSYWEEFRQQRMAAQHARLHPHADLVRTHRPPPIKA